MTEHVASARDVTHTAPPPVSIYVDRVPLVTCAAPATVIEHVAAPAVTYAAAAPVIERVATGHKSSKKAKKSSRSKRQHHHDDDDLLLSEATALADHERAVMREEIRIMLAAEPHRCPLRHRMCMSDGPRQCQECHQCAEELAWCTTCEQGVCSRCFLASTTGTPVERGLGTIPGRFGENP